MIRPEEKFNKVYSFSDNTGEEKVKACFVDELYQCKQLVENYYADQVESAVAMKDLTSQQEADYLAATHCYICSQPFLDFEKAGIS